MKDPELINLNYKVITEHKNEYPWKKIGLIITVLSLILILIIVLTIIYMINNSNSSDNIGKNNLGEIICTYEVESTKEETEILSEKFNNTNSFDIFIDKKKNSIFKKEKV